MRQVTPIKRSAVKSTTPKNRLETPLTQTAYTDPKFLQKVQETAYRLYIERGCENGHDVEDWIKAEQIVKGS